MNDLIRLFSGLMLLLALTSCDSLPRSRYLIANTSTSDLRVRLYTSEIQTAVPCLYAPDEWKKKGSTCADRTRIGFEINSEGKWMETVIAPGAAVELGNARYPAEENIEDDFTIVRVDLQGSSGAITWDGGTRVVFDHLQKEDDGFLDFISGNSPKYVYRYE
jgi:hypothetical protein